MRKVRRGLIIVFTGNGKGKTTAALGMSMRFVGHGKKVFFLQFLKKWPYGELKSASRFGKYLTLRQAGTGDFCSKKSATQKRHKEAAKKAIKLAERAVASGKYHLVVLDEINCAVRFGLIPLKRVIGLIRSKPKSIHLVLTGRWAHRGLIKEADLVTEMKERKHPYLSGTLAQKGIEF